MLKKNDVCEILISDIGHKGEGIGKVDGCVLFVENTLPGDFCRVKVLKMNKSFGYGKVLEIIKPSEHRIDAPCPVAEKCGGCSLQHMNYEAQLFYKQKKVVDSLKRIGGIEAAETMVLPIIGMDEPFRYRNKIQVPVQMVDGEISMGYYTKNSHRIVPWDHCLLQPEQADEILGQIRAYMEECNVSAYDEQRHTGLIRHIMLRFGQDEAVMVCIIANLKNGKALPGEERMLEQITAVPGVQSVVLNYNDKKSNVIMGESERLLWGAPYIHCNIGSAIYRLSPLSFFQVNTVQTQTMYDLVLEYGAFRKTDVLLDAYCGIGSIGLYVAPYVRHVYGIEVVEAAVHDAKVNAELNRIDNCDFFTGKAEDYIYRLMEEESLKPDVVIVDPPRKGCDRAMLEAILSMAPDRIIYVSCNPDTLARDLTILAPSYGLSKAQPLDMFPHTAHVETVCLLTKNN